MGGEGEAVHVSLQNPVSLIRIDSHSYRYSLLVVTDFLGGGTLESTKVSRGMRLLYLRHGYLKCIIGGQSLQCSVAGVIIVSLQNTKVIDETLQGERINNWWNC